MGIACPTGLHRHEQTCSRCSVSDQTVATTVTRDGTRWPPLCSTCASRVHRQTKAALLSALDEHVNRMAA